MRHKESGVTVIELMIVTLVVGILAAIAIPIAMNGIKNYRLHADATSIASYLNVTRMNAASQYAPYRLIVDAAAGTYTEEQLCGNTPVATDPACTGPYQEHTTPQYIGGTQLASTEVTFSSCRPGSISGPTYPGTIVGDPVGCPNPLSIYFNTRGSPVNNTGNPLGNGGAVLYLTNQNQLTDAVTVAIGGRVAVYMWDSMAGAWSLR